MKRNDFFSAVARIADSAIEVNKPNTLDAEVGITASMSRTDAHEKLREYLDVNKYSKEAIKKVARIMHAHGWESLKTERNGRKELIAIATDQNGTPRYSYKQKAWEKVVDAQDDPLFIDDIDPEDRDLNWLRFGSSFKKIGSGYTESYEFKDPYVFNIESIIVKHPSSGSIEKGPTSDAWVASLLTNSGRRLVGTAAKTPKEAVAELRKKLQDVIADESVDKVSDAEDIADAGLSYAFANDLYNLLKKIFRGNTKVAARALINEMGADEQVEFQDVLRRKLNLGDESGDVKEWLKKGVALGDDIIMEYAYWASIDEVEDMMDAFRRKYRISDSADMIGLFGKVMHHVDELVGMLDEMGAPAKKSKKYMWRWFNALNTAQVGKLREALDGIGDSRSVRYKVGDAARLSREEIINNPPAWVTDKELWARAADKATKGGKDKVEGILPIAVYRKMGGKIGDKTTDSNPQFIESAETIDRMIPEELKNRLREALEDESKAQEEYSRLKLTPLYEYSSKNTKLMNEAADRYREAMKNVIRIRKAVNIERDKALAQINS